jgi:hypothetical protein
MTKQETARLVALALANWPSMQDKSFKVEGTAALWHKMLGHLPYSVVEAGLAKILLTSKYFPTVAEILAAAESLQPKSQGLPPVEAAWDEVCRNLNPYQAPVWSHDGIRLTVRRLGGIRTLCESENMGPIRAHFFKLYEALAEREKEQTINSKVAALLERANIKLIKEI